MCEKPGKDRGRVTCPVLLILLSVDKMSGSIIVQALAAFPPRSFFIQPLEKSPVSEAGKGV